MAEVVALRHVPFEDLGLLAPLLETRRLAPRYVEAPTDDLDALDPAAPELLIVLGGPIGAGDDDAYPFLRQELRLVEARLAAERPILGICLGSQIIARALGSRIYPAPRPEIGWGPITLSEAGKDSCLRHLAPEETAVLHWHGDTFDLPDGADLLASTELCENQAFRWDKTALALQFHAEATGRGLERWFVGHTLEIAATPGVTVAGLRADTARWSPIVAERGHRCFEEWLAEVGL